MRRLSILYLCVACCGLMLSVGCGGGDKPTPDAGPPDVPPPTPDAGHPDAGVPDAGPIDLIRPTITTFSPENNAIAVPPDSSIIVKFSEPMQTDRGLLQITPGNFLVRARPEFWDAAKRTVTFSFAQGLTPKAKMTISIVDFADLAGNPIPETVTFNFTVGTGTPPQITSATPSEGASQVSETTAEVDFTFSEPMDTTAGTLTPSTGLTLGTPSWTDSQHLQVPISGLGNNLAYSIRLTGFQTPRGAALDLTAYLGDGKLDFTTGPDKTPPTVTDASPAEGAQNVPTDSTSLLVITFSEPMTTVGTTATLVDGTTRTVLSPTWSSDGFNVTYTVLDLLRPNATLRVELTGFKDKAGNALSTTTYLGNGAIDFTTAPDRIRPYVVSTDPEDGAEDVYPYETYLQSSSPATVGQRKVVTIRFSEPMDTSITQSTLTAPNQSTVPPRSITGMWAADRRTLTFSIPPPATGGPPLEELREYSLDLTNHKDPSGNMLDTTLGPVRAGQLTFDTIQNDSVLNLACEDMLLKSVSNVTATSTATGTTPRTDVLRQRYGVLLPSDGNGKYQGYTRFQPGTNALYSMFLSQSVPTVMTDATTGSAVDVTQGATPAACPNNITYRVDFGRTSNPELRVRFGPATGASFQLVTHGTL